MKLGKSLLILYFSTVGLNLAGNMGKAIYFSYQMNNNGNNYSKHEKKYNKIADELLTLKTLKPGSVFGWWDKKEKDITKKLHN